MPANRTRTGNKTSFKPGQSGNPKGRPKQTKEQKDALAMIRDMAPEAVERLREIIRDPKVKAEAQIKAIEIVLERTYGRPAAYDPTQGSAVNGLLQSLLDMELKRRDD